MSYREWVLRYGRRTVNRRKAAVPKKYVGRWVDVAEMLPPERIPVLVQFIVGGSCPEVAWLKYAAGDRSSPFFVSGAGAQYVARNVVEEPRYDDQAGLMEYRRLHSVVRWYSPSTEGLPWAPPDLPGEAVGAFGFIDANTGVCPTHPELTPLALE